MHRVAEPVCNAGFLKQVTQHQTANQRGCVRQQQRHKDSNQNGEDNLFRLGNRTGLHHLNGALLRGGKQIHNGGLNHGNQRHVRVSCHGNSTQQTGGKLGGKENGGRAVCTADDADRGGFTAGKAQGNRTEERHKHAHLGGSAQQQALGIAQQRAKVRHGAHAHKNQTGVQTGFYADVENIQQTALSHNRAIAVIQGTFRIHKAVPQLLVVQPALGQVAQQAAKGDTYQKQGLKFLDDA